MGSTAKFRKFSEVFPTLSDVQLVIDILDDIITFFTVENSHHKGMFLKTIQDDSKLLKELLARTRSVLSNDRVSYLLPGFLGAIKSCIDDIVRLVMSQSSSEEITKLNSYIAGVNVADRVERFGRSDTLGKYDYSHFNCRILNDLQKTYQLTPEQDLLIRKYYALFYIGIPYDIDSQLLLDILALPKRPEGTDTSSFVFDDGKEFNNPRRKPGRTREP